MPRKKTPFDPELAAELCEYLANGGSLREWCRMDGHPCFNVVYNWLEEDESFSNAYARARERQAHNDADRLNELIERVESGNIGANEARIVADILKWTAARRAPKSYGDKVQLTGTADGAPLVVSWLEPTDR